jgi:CRISPR-associated endonuclease/helicase Cas3
MVFSARWRWCLADLQAGDFRQFFYELHGYMPFPWQERLAEKVCTTGWPQVIDLPTASGKTACVDIALFALALRGRSVPRRIFFVVDRRVVVNEAYLRMKEVARRLSQAETGAVGAVAQCLKRLSGTDEPVQVYEMRGGAFRDETWVRNPLQPAVIASTVDQVGSRLLFRGYGVSDSSWPIHAGLIGNDALIILDEAHCSRAFAQTLQRIERYRGAIWAEVPIKAPFQFVEMTATPSRPSEAPFHITDEDRRDERFQKRLYASKPARLIEVKAKKEDFGKLADKLIAQAIDLARRADARRVAIMVNRVGTAKTVRQRLREWEGGRDACIELVIRSMRAVDRDNLYEQTLKGLKSGTERRADSPLTFVVATQCLEVGADLDFDVLVSECASIDALQQRFGRLDRLGEFGRACGAIVIGSWQKDPKVTDAVYGEALSRTWEWIDGIASDRREINMGIEAAEGQPPTINQLLASIDAGQLRLLGEDAPILLPAHIDALAQTSPPPEPEPLVELFLHGPRRSVADVHVLWRADLDNEPPEAWEEIVSLCPPSSREAMPVQINAFKRWFAGEIAAGDIESDLESGIQHKDYAKRHQMKALVWQGDKSELISDSSKVKPGQTLVLPVSAKGWNEIGYIPDGRTIDVGDQGAFEARGTVCLRLHAGVMEEWPQPEALKPVRDYVGKDAEPGEMEARLEAYLAELKAHADKRWPYEFLNCLKDLRRRKLNAYPGQRQAYVLQARRSSPSQQGGGPVLLDKHLEDVENAAEEIASSLVTALSEALRNAAKFHDYGKVDVRYQAWLHGGDLMAAWFAPKPLAKSGDDPLGKQEIAGLPMGFRHELLSLMFAERCAHLNGDLRDLTLHLVASHHGRCRPFAPVVQDKNAECVSWGGIKISRNERLDNAPHRLDRGVADRFWKLTRIYGWWGLAYLEAIFRLADWKASEKEGAEVSN